MIILIRRKPLEYTTFENIEQAQNYYETTAKKLEKISKSLEKYSPKHSIAALNLISDLVVDLDNWSVCDSLAMYGVKPIVYLKPEQVLHSLKNGL